MSTSRNVHARNCAKSLLVSVFSYCKATRSRLSDKSRAQTSKAGRRPASSKVSKVVDISKVFQAFKIFKVSEVSKGSFPKPSKVLHAGSASKALEPLETLEASETLEALKISETLEALKILETSEALKLELTPPLLFMHSLFVTVGSTLPGYMLTLVGQVSLLVSL